MRKLDRSRQLQQRAERLLPGGVDSPVRAFRAVGGDPPFVVRAEGAYLWDADGNKYLDFFGSWGPMILGHAFESVVEAIQQAASRGASFGANTDSFVLGDNYVYLTAVADGAGDVTLLGHDLNGEANINGVQVMAVPEPSELVLLMAGGMIIAGLVVRRKRAR